MADKQTGGRWNKDDWPMYFIASNVAFMEMAGSEPRKLVAINEMMDDKLLDTVERWCDAGQTIFIDSGIFAMTNEHARNHDVSMDEALSLKPEEIDGFDELYDRYLVVCSRLADKAWGYIELDQGGMESKKRIRADLESKGLKPIPVYHPVNDGWDYFDELAGGYDRICFGNVVQAPRNERMRLVATAWERKRKYPDLWIHLLGLTPSPLLVALPINSADSSTWTASVRYPMAARTRVCLAPFSRYERDMQYTLGNKDEWAKAVRMSAADAYFDELVWRGMLSDYKALGCDPVARIA